MTIEVNANFDPDAWLKAAQIFGFKVQLVRGGLSIGYPNEWRDGAKEIQKEGNKHSEAIVGHLKGLAVERGDYSQLDIVPCFERALEALEDAEREVSFIPKGERVDSIRHFIGRQIIALRSVAAMIPFLGGAEITPADRDALDKAIEELEEKHQVWVASVDALAVEAA